MFVYLFVCCCFQPWLDVGCSANSIIIVIVVVVDVVVVPAGNGIGLILVGLTVRLAISYIVVLGNHFSWTEMGFVAIAWIPKATVQVCIYMYMYAYMYNIYSVCL